MHFLHAALGSVLLATHRLVSHMADLTAAEWQEFQVVITSLERAFGVALINPVYRRNWAY